MDRSSQSTLAASSFTLLHGECKERGRGREREEERERKREREEERERERETQSGFGSPTSLTGPVSIKIDLAISTWLLDHQNGPFFYELPKRRFILVSVDPPPSLSLSLSLRF